MTEFNYLKPVTEIVCLSLKDKLLVDGDPDITTSTNPLANQNMHFDNSEDPNDDHLQSDTDNGGLWDE